MAEGDLVEVTLWHATAIASGGTLTSVPLSSAVMDPESLLLKVVSAAGAADVKVEVELDQDGAGTYGTATAQDPLCASTATEFAGQLPEERHVLALPALPRFRILVTELASLSDTLV